MLKKFVHYLSNKKANILLVGCFLLVLNNSYSQENNKNLYFIAGHIYRNIPGQYFSYLFRYHNKTLDTIAILSNDSTQLRFIKAYHDQRKVVILKDGYIYNDDCILQIISMDNPENIKTLNMGNGNDFFEMNLVFYNDSFYYVFEKEGEYMGINLNSLSTYVFNDPEILLNTIIKGTVGGAMEFDTRDCLTLKKDKDSDKIFIPGPFGKRTYLGYLLPKEYLSNNLYYSLLTSNKNYLILWSNHSESNKAKIIGWSDIFIFNKLNKQWYKLKIRGNHVNIINFNKWIGGWITERYDGKNGFEWISPGEKDRKKNNNLLGSTFDERALDLWDYMPGVLYLYNLETKQYIEWETGQGDSEILLIEDDIVYYRVADKIYKSPIIEGKSIGKPELIIQDERVHDIHWAFISEK